MKTKIKRHSRSFLSVILAVCMVVSCLTVGLIATDAAKVTGEEDTTVGANVDDEEVGAKAVDDEEVGAVDEGEPVALDSGDGIHLGIGSTTTTWHSMGSNEYSFELASATTIYYTFSCSGGNFGKGNQSNPSESSLETYTWYAIKGDNTQYSISLSAGTYKFKLKGIQSGNANCLEYQFWKSSGGGGGGDDPTPSGDVTEVTDEDLIAVLNGTKIMFYVGEDKNWGNNSTYYINTTNSTSNPVASATKNDTAVDYGSNGGYKFALFTAAAADYYMGHWASGLHTDVTNYAGYAFGIRDKTNSPFDDHTWLMNNSNDANSLYRITNGTRTVTTTVTSPIGQGHSLSVSSGSAGKSVLKLDNTIEYYIKSGNTYYKYTASNGSINTSALASGSYTLKTVLKDERGLRVVADSDNFTVLPKLASSLSISASPTELSEVDETSTITVTATNIASGLTNLSYRVYDRADNSVVASTNVTNGATSVTFTVTPNARSKSYYASVLPTSSDQQELYDEVWTSADAVITNSADAYIPRYTVTYSSNNDSNGTVTAKTADGTAVASGSQVKEGTSVIFTATPTTGNVFYEWYDVANSSKLDSSANSITRVIRANTNLQGKFGPKGYSIMAGDSTKVAMRELSNGTYISKNSYGAGNWFQLYRNSTGSRSLSSEVSQGVAPDGTKYKVTDWEVNSDWGGNCFTTYDDQSGSRYIVYDPSTDQVWLTSDPDDLYSVTVIAKDGTIRDGYSTSCGFGNTTIEMVSPNAFTSLSSGYVYSNDSYKVDSVAGTGRAEYLEIPADDVRNGVTIKIKTQTTQAKVNEGYYVKGFVVSGYEESFSLLWQEFDDSGDELSSYDDREWIHSGYNEFTLTINGYPEKSIEITPVYYKRETTSGDNVRFYVDGFAGDVYKTWGGTIAVDAYDTNDSHFYGDYPGQLMVNYNGRYLMDIPRANLKGITMNNYIWDKVHNHYAYGDAGINYQTYDFNDFVYIEDMLTNDTDPNNDDEDIFFSFRYKFDEDYDTKADSNLGESVYYENYTGGDDPTRTGDYRKNFSTINPNDAIYNWEDFTDIYGNRVDIFNDYVDTTDTSGNPTNPKATYTNPIRVVSNGYDYNAAGKYATAWAFYAPVDASNHLAPTGDYHHYALIDVFGSQGNTNYDSSSYIYDRQFAENLRWKYDQAYRTAHSGETPAADFIFDLAKMPMVISYEYTIQSGHSNLNVDGQSGDGEVGYRSDGRWYYSKSDQLLTAHTIIEYAEKDEESLYHRDFYQGNGIDYTSASGYDPTANTGLATGIQAYFENSDSGEAGTFDYSNTSGNTEAYEISDGEHHFNLKTIHDPNGDYTFKGWYLYSNGKYTFVSRSEEYPSEATANDVYVARYYKTPAGTLNITHNLDSNSDGTADCYAKVEVLNSSGTVIDNTSYPETTNSIKVGTNYIKSGSDNQLRITLRTVPGAYCSFEQFKENISGTLRELTQANVRTSVTGATVSTTSGPTYTATITFTIGNLFSGDDQTVKAMPFFSKVKKDTYYYKLIYNYPSRSYGQQTYTEEGTFTDEDHSNSDYFDSSTNRLKKAFVQKYCPYEDNFMKEMSWNFDSGVTYGVETKNNTNDTFTATITATQSSDTATRRLQFVLPYEYTTTTYGGIKIYTAKDEVPEYAASTDNPSSANVDYMGLYRGEETVAGQTVYHYTQAPASVKVINDGNVTTYPFQYWSIKVGTSEVARCYSRNFNFSMFNNYTVTPVFSNTGTGSISTGTSTSITFLEYSRNQWNKGDKGTRETSKTAMDTVYVDFDLSFENAGELIDSESSTDVGVIIENCGTLDSDGEDGYITDMSHYSSKTQYTDQLKNFINGTITEAQYKTASGSYKVTKKSVDKSQLTNKNRMEYYLGINASENGTDLNNRTSLYRIYSYIKSGSTVTLSSPVYININATAALRGVEN